MNDEVKTNSFSSSFRVHRFFVTLRVSAALSHSFGTLNYASLRARRKRNIRVVATVLTG